MYVFVSAVVAKWEKVEFYVSQGSVSTQLRCGGKHDVGFITNFLLNPKMKEFWKFANICQNY